MYPPQLASDLESVPIHRSTSARCDAAVLADAAAGRCPSFPASAPRRRAASRWCFFLTSTKRAQVGVVAVHAVDALDGDQHAAIAVADAGEQRVERAPVVVGEAAAGRAGEPRALEDRVVGQDVVDDQVARAHQVADRRDVGRVPGDEDDRRGRAEKCGERAARDRDGSAFRRRPGGWRRRRCRSDRSRPWWRRRPPGRGPCRRSRRRRSCVSARPSMWARPRVPDVGESSPWSTRK